ncbi:glycosyltransferase [Pseudohoeflea coraliihabitans]|uniref:Glycosyltransferase n=1 Tax=Pseudohoeflea coraliihabitans TaxID=2860393 RepID=A0ABS6WR40_9HYPH|nr:hypothetical protein [Pseudohoeflea sp. DP4N28-3]MBW3097515.1 hypothetical protein [Pseudohoeflea sp. DP4N28-3]
MNYYMFPGTGIFGGIKVGFQFCDMLAELGLPILAVTPDGQAPLWFPSTVAVIARSDFEAAVSADDSVFFSLPADHDWLAPLPARRIFHCQGTDPLIEPVIADPALALLACWPQAERFMREKTGRPVSNVGISVSDCFFYDGEPKGDTVVAYMPRRGRDIAQDCRRRMRRHRFEEISGLNESDCAYAMKRAGWYLATAPGEFFGLPALEAMAAGCLVASVPVIGGMDYLEPGFNCLLAPPDDLPAAASAVTGKAQAARRAALRQQGLATAYRYRRSRHLRLLKRQIAGPLEELVSWK